VLVYFGYPSAHEDDAVRAIYAGLAIVRAVKRLGKRVLADQGGRLRARVGVATGVVVVGDLVGQEGSEAGAVTGETPTLAFRLQGLARPGEAVVADRTRALAGEAFTYEASEERALKGFPEPVRLWRVLGPSGAESRFEALHGRWLTPLVGREQELALLLERWHRAKEGEGQVVLVSGEAGIGKSRLTEILRERVMADDHVRLRLQCSPYHTNSALHPVIEHLERAAGFEREDGPDVRLAKLEILVGRAGVALAEAVPLMAALLSVPTGDRYPPLAMSPQRQKERTLASLADQAVGLAATKPVLVIVEDAHWIDPTTQESLDLIVGRAEAAAILVVATGRPEYRPAWLSRPNATTVALNRLSRRQGASMVASVVGGRALPPEILEQVVEKTDGVPLFVEELTRMVLESGLLREEDGRYVLDGPLPPLAIPATLRDSLMARLDRLAPAKDVAQTAAAIGRTFRHDLLAAVVARDDADLASALDQLVEAGLVFRQGVGSEATYTFKHVLVQDAAHQSLLRSQRQRLHARIADVMESRFADRIDAAPEIMARHYAEAGLAEAAIRWWHKAGEAAVGRAAFEEAEAHLDAARALLPSIDDSARRRRAEAELAITRAQASLVRNGYADARTKAFYAEADTLAQAADDARLLLLARYGVWAYHHVREETPPALDCAERLLVEARERRDPDLDMFAHRMLGASMAMAGRLDEACATFGRAREMYDPARHRPLGLGMGTDPLVAINCYQSMAELARGYPERARAMSAEAREIVKDVAQVNAKAYALFHCGMLAVLARATADAMELGSGLTSLSGAHGLSFWGAMAGSIVAGSLLSRGDATGAAEQMSRSLAAAKATGSGILGGCLQSMLAEAEAETGNGEAIATSVAAEVQARRSGAFYALAEVQRRQGLVLRLLRPAATDEAEAAFRGALATARRQNARLWELRAAADLARLLKDRGRAREAHDLLAPILGWFTEGFGTRDLIEAKALLEALA
jgi:predicted ATPase